MASKTYQLNIAKSDGTSESVSFTILDVIGTYNIKFTLSDGQEIDAGNITVDDTEHTYNLKLTLSDGSTITAGEIVTPAGIYKPTFANSSWDKIAEISESGLAREYFAVGDEKTIRLSTGEEITLVILGFNHDDLWRESGKAGITIGMKNLLSHTMKYPMNSTPTNEGGWSGSVMRTATIPYLLSQLPSELKSVIKMVNKKSTGGDMSTGWTSSGDKLWLLAKVEVDGTTSAGYAYEGEQYEYWKTVKDGTVDTDRIKYLSNGKGTPSSWWLRSPYISAQGGFCAFTFNGSVSDTPATQRNAVSFCFCV